MLRRTINPLPQFQKTTVFSPTVAGSTQVETSEIFDAVVVDVISNENHNDYSNDGYNMGFIKVRTVASQLYVSQDDLQWAMPEDSTISEYPLINELVQVYESNNKLYYKRKTNVGNNPNHQAIFGLESEMGFHNSPQSQIENRNNAQINPINQDTTPSRTLGSYYKEVPTIRRLRHWEGDTIYEGRMGQTIRFGTSWLDSQINGGLFKAEEIDQSPNVIIRVGQSPTADVSVDFGTIVENIDEDLTSIWMVTDQIVPLTAATVSNQAVHHRSVRNAPSKYSGNQILINSGRVVINSKAEKIFMYSGAGTHLTTLGDTTFDMAGDNRSYVGRTKATEIVADEVQNVGRDSVLWYGRDYARQVSRNYSVYVGQEVHINSRNRMSLVSKKIFVGSVGDTREPMVLGKSLVAALMRFIDAHLDNQATHVTSPIVGYSMLSAPVVTALQTLRDELEELILSKDNYVSKQNVEPVLPPDREPIQLQ